MTDTARWHEFAYEQTDIPAGMTVRDWRCQRAMLSRRRRWLYRSLRGRFRRRPGAAVRKSRTSGAGSLA